MERVTPCGFFGGESNVALRQILITQRKKHLKSSKNVSLKKKDESKTKHFPNHVATDSDGIKP